MEKVLIFLAFLCPLIFFHELGHFFFARFFGVRVEVFSIGFGPQLFKFVKKGTLFTISLIPLGGYVKLFGDDPFSEIPIPEEERKFAFNHKGKWARFWILFGGPLANFIFAFVLFFIILMTGEKVPEARVGLITKDSLLAQKGLLLGDRIVRLNNRDVEGLMDLDLGETEMLKTITVKREGLLKEMTLDLSFKQFVEEFFKYPPHFRRPLVIDRRGSYYILTAKKGELEWNNSLEELELTFNKKTPIYLYRLQNPFYKDTLLPSPDYAEEEVIMPTAKGDSLLTLLYKKDIYPHDLRVEKMIEDAPAMKAGLKPNDLIVTLDKQSLSGFEELRLKLQDQKKDIPVFIQYYRNDILHSAHLRPEAVVEEQKTVFRLGLYSSAYFTPIPFIETKGKGLIPSALEAFKRTAEGTVRILVELKRLIFHEVSFKNIGGPLAIGKVASDSLDIGISYFFKLMAIISINLGLINLFPIPVLDGGHILFIGLEILNGAPLSRRKLEIAQNIGVVILFSLVFFSLFNDISRLFG